MREAPRAGLVETFWSVQGEGHNAGRAAYFIRFSGCNLDCVFADGAICDTPWRTAQEKLTLDEAMGRALAAASPPHAFETTNWDHRPMLVLTGGEPCMQPQFDDFVDRGLEHGFYVAVETNGTMWRDSLRRISWISCSPKDNVRHANPLTTPELHPDLVELLRKKPGEYRHVIGPEDPLPEWRPAFKHYLSPAILADGSGKEHITGFPGFVPGAPDRCMELAQLDPRWRVSLQTHKFMGAR